MSESLNIPKFASETEEADWWYEHRADLEKVFDQKEAAGTLRRTSLRERFPEKFATTVRLDDNDAALARELAEKSGETFETYVKRVVHQALVLQKSA